MTVPMAWPSGRSRRGRRKRPCAEGPDADETARRLQAAGRRGVVRLLTKKDAWEAADSLTFRHNYEHVRDAVLVSPWECTKRCSTALRAAARTRRSPTWSGPWNSHRPTPWSWTQWRPSMPAIGAGTVRPRPWRRHCAANPELPRTWINVADANLARGDRAAYRRLVRKCSAFSPAPTDPRAAVEIALRCLLLPDAVEDRRAVEQRAEWAPGNLPSGTGTPPGKGHDHPCVVQFKALADIAPDISRPPANG